MVSHTPFSSLNGEEVELITLTDGTLTAQLLPYGATLRSLTVPDRTGGPVDVVLGYDTLEEYASQDACLGGTIGRYANRIADADLPIDGKHWPLLPNEGANQLHGGPAGFHQKLWQVEAETECSVTFSLLSPHLDGGFPGNLRVELTYSLPTPGTLALSYRARTDRATAVSLTNHAYFNLSGHDSGQVGDHLLLVGAEGYTPTGPGLIPTGELLPVVGTPLDFRVPTPLSPRLADPFFAPSRGLDHNFILSGGACAARLISPRTGIAMAVETTLPGMQVYSAGFLTQRRGKSGASYGPSHAVCLETQHFPDAVHRPAFPSPLLRPGEEYSHLTKYQFSLWEG